MTPMFVVLFIVALCFWVLIWKLIKRGTDTLEDIFAKFERNRHR